MPRDLERQTGPKSTGPTVRSICEALNHISISFRSNCKHITRAGARRCNNVWPSTQGHLIAHVGGCYSHRKATCPPQDVTMLAFHAICFRRLFFFFQILFCGGLCTSPQRSPSFPLQVTLSDQLCFKKGKQNQIHYLGLIFGFSPMFLYFDCMFLNF